MESSVNSRRSANYKPYTLREYKDKFIQDDSIVNKTRGGLGADIGGEKWQIANEKRKRMKEFALKVIEPHCQLLTSFLGASTGLRVFLNDPNHIFASLI